MNTKKLLVVLGFVVFAPVIMAFSTERGMFIGSDLMNISNWSWSQIFVGFILGFFVGFVVFKRR